MHRILKKQKSIQMQNNIDKAKHEIDAFVAKIASILKGIIKPNLWTIAAVINTKAL